MKGLHAAFSEVLAILQNVSHVDVFYKPEEDSVFAIYVVGDSNYPNQYFDAFHVVTFRTRVKFVDFCTAVTYGIKRFNEYCEEDFICEHI